MKSAFSGPATDPANVSSSLDEKSAPLSASSPVAESMDSVMEPALLGASFSPPSVVVIADVRIKEIVEGWAADLIRDSLPAHHYSQFCSMQDALPELIARLEAL